MRFEVLERGPDLWRILDHQRLTIDYVRFGVHAFALVAVTVEAEHHGAREPVIRRLDQRLARLEGRAPIPCQDVSAAGKPRDPEPVEGEVDAGYLWRRFIYGTD